MENWKGNIESLGWIEITKNSYLFKLKDYKLLFLLDIEEFCIEKNNLKKGIYRIKINNKEELEVLMKQLEII